MKPKHSFLSVTALLLTAALFSTGCGQAEGGESQASNGWWPFGGETVVVPAGTTVRVRLTTGLSSEKNSGGDTWEGTLDHDLVVGDKVIFPRGTDVEGKVTHAVDSGRLKQRAELWLTLTEIDGHEVHTTTAGAKEGSKAKRNILIIGGSSGAGALIGGLTGGGKGAAIGAGIGAGGGTAAAALTGERDVVFPPETLLRFTLKEEAEVKL